MFRVRDVTDVAREVKATADLTDFSGVVSVSRGDERLIELSRGLADRSHERPNTLTTRFATASATMGLTALTVASLIDSGALGFDTTIRRPDARCPARRRSRGHRRPASRSHLGVGDYLDEEEITDIEGHVLDVPASPTWSRCGRHCSPGRSCPWLSSSHSSKPGVTRLPRVSTTGSDSGSTRTDRS
ncbi:MAG: serine hydrolase [Acidimicrobiales bacterium]